MGPISTLRRRERGSVVGEAAVTIPVVLLIAIFMVNAAIAGFAAVNAANAANYGARAGSVAQAGAASRAVAAARSNLATAPVGEYSVSASGGGAPGTQIRVTVNWTVPNYMGGLMGFFGGGNVDFKGSSTSSFRQEGW